MLDLDKFNIKSLFVLYLIISGNYLGQLLSCKVQKHFQNNMIIKHLLGFMTLYFFVIFAGNSDQPIWTQMNTTIILYLWFILTTRTDIRYTIVILLSLLGIYIIDSQIKWYKSLYKDDKNKPKNYHKIIKIFEYAYNGMFLVAVAATLIGFAVYLGEKRFEYEKNWSWKKFFIGKPLCNFTDVGNPVGKSDFEYIEMAFDSLC